MGEKLMFAHHQKPQGHKRFGSKGAPRGCGGGRGVCGLGAQAGSKAVRDDAARRKDGAGGRANGAGDRGWGNERGSCGGTQLGLAQRRRGCGGSAALLNSLARLAILLLRALQLLQ